MDKTIEEYKKDHPELVCRTFDRAIHDSKQIGVEPWEWTHYITPGSAPEIAETFKGNSCDTILLANGELCHDPEERFDKILRGFGNSELEAWADAIENDEINGFF